MKKLTIYIGLVVMFLTACQRENIDVFKGRSELYFEKFYRNAVYPGTESADSTIASFFFYPDGTQDIKAELTILYSGLPLTEDIPFQLEVVEELTTAKPEEYTLEPEYIFHARGTIDSLANDIRDKIGITIHRSSRLTEGGNALLCVELVPNEKIAWGQIERVRARIFLTTQAAQPVWWNEEVTKNLLGRYSQTKYKLFLNNIDKKAEMNEQLIQEHPDEAIALTLRFKEWLMQQQPLLTDEYGVINVAL